MELVSGESITKYVDDAGLGLRDRLTLFAAVCRAVEHAHQKGVIHRDIKPSNILVSGDDGVHRPRIIDFGIAKATGAAISEETLHTRIGDVLGTPEYMSPEQLAGERLDGRSDIYSLGLVFFHLLTADLAHPRVTSRETLVHRLTEPPRTLSEARPGKQWPANLQPMLDWALATDPTKRYPTAQEFSLDLSILINTAPADPPRKTVPMQSGEVVSPSAPTVVENTPADVNPGVK